MVTAGVEETTRLLENKFDCIFFTSTSHRDAPVPSLSSRQGDRLVWIRWEVLTMLGSRCSPCPQAAPPWGGSRWQPLPSA